jgi:hypothetical protein
MRTVLPLIILAAFAVNGCSHKAPVEDIDKAGTQFFLRLKKAEYGAIYDDGADEFTKAKSKAEVTNNLEKLVGMGRPQQWKRISLKFNDPGKGHYALADYIVDTDNLTVNVELTLLDDDGEWKLSGFTAIPHGR